MDDAGEGIILAAENYNKSDPVNLGAGKEITIKDLVCLVTQLCDYNGMIVWDKSKPDGQPRRCLDTARARNEFGFVAKTPFEIGLKKIIDWYYKNSNIKAKDLTRI